MPMATVCRIIAECGAPDGPWPAVGPVAIAPLPKTSLRRGREWAKKERKKEKKLTSFTPDSLITASLLWFFLCCWIRHTAPFKKCAWLLLNFNALPLPWPAGKVCPPSALKREISNVVLLIMDGVWMQAAGVSILAPWIQRILRQQ